MTSPDAIVTTERLRLIPLSAALIDAVLAGDLVGAQQVAPFPVTDQTFVADQAVLRMRQAQLQVDPTIEAWLYRAAVDRQTGQVVARIGFHAQPDAVGTVEVGYSVQADHRRRGLATEMTLALVAWGRANGARTVLASTSPANLASQGVLARLGFVRTGEQIDEVDGLEWVFTQAPGITSGDNDG